MNIALTGAAGRVGSAVCHKLVEAGHVVKAVDRVYRRDLPVPVKVLNLLDPTSAYEALDGTEFLVHLANHPMFRGRDSQRILNENVAMNMNVFQAAAEMGIRRIVFASSVQAFAHETPGQKSDQVPLYLPLDGHVPENPWNPYALSKVLTERMLKYFAAEYDGMSCIALRLPHILVGNSAPHLRMWLESLSSPHEGFAFLHANDAGSLVVALAAANLAPGYRCYFPAARTPSNGKPIPQLLREFYPNVPLRKPADCIHSLVDLDELERDTGWAPTFNGV